MTDLKLDSLSQCVLYLFKERRYLSLQQIAFLANAPMEVFPQAILELWHGGYIHSDDDANMDTIKTDQVFTITPKGYLFFEEKEKQQRELHETRIWKLIPVVISSVSLLIAFASLYISYLTYIARH